jgi:hypothetical protein
MPESGEIPVYPMTAIDEITSKTPDALYNGSAVADIIKSCVPAVLEPWAVTSTDLDALLVAIKIATNGNDMDIETTCPSCDTEQKYGVNLSFILNGFVPGDYDKPTKIHELTIKFKPLIFKELTATTIKQIEIQRMLINISAMEDGPEKDTRSNQTLQSISKSTLEVLANTIEYIATPEVVVTEKAYIIDFLSNTDKKTFDVIKDRSVELRETTQTKPLHIACSNCTHEYDQTFTLNVSDFFA